MDNIVHLETDLTRRKAKQESRRNKLAIGAAAVVAGSIGISALFNAGPDAPSNAPRSNPAEVGYLKGQPNREGKRFVPFRSGVIVLSQGVNIRSYPDGDIIKTIKTGHLGLFTDPIEYVDPNSNNTWYGGFVEAGNGIAAQFGWFDATDINSQSAFDPDHPLIKAYGFTDRNPGGELTDGIALVEDNGHFVISSFDSTIGSNVTNPPNDVGNYQELEAKKFETWANAHKLVLAPASF